MIYQDVVAYDWWIKARGTGKESVMQVRPRLSGMHEGQLPDSMDRTAPQSKSNI